jgi:hypothetical protein
MTRSDVRTLINNAVDALAETIRFNSGRITEFNSQRSNEYPYVWLEPLSRGTEFRDTDQMPMDEWNVILHFAKKDAAGSIPEEYENIVDECDLLAKQFTNKLNSVIDGYKLITLSGLTSEPFIHRHADDTSGVVLSFTINSPDQTDVC